MFICDITFIYDEAEYALTRGVKGFEPGHLETTQYLPPVSC